MGELAWYNSLSDLTGDIKKGATDVAHTVGSVASNPWVDAGLGLLTGGATIPLLAGAAGGLLKPGGNIKSGVTGAVEGGLTGLGGEDLGSILNAYSTGGLDGALGALKGDVTGLGKTLLNGGKGLLNSAASDIFGGGDGSGSGSGGGFNLGSLAKDGVLAGAVAQTAADRSKQSGLIDDATKVASAQYDQNAPLRARAVAELSSDQAAPDLSNIFANPGNVYDRERRGMPPLTTTPSAASQLTAGSALSGALASRVPVTPPPAALQSASAAAA